jgi:hypothetical protein
MLAAPRGPTAVPRPPAGAVLARLDAALGAAHAALSAAHPAAIRPRSRQAASAPPLLSTAALVITRTAELRHLLARYQRTSIDDPQPGPAHRDERQGAFAF